MHIAASIVGLLAALNLHAMGAGPRAVFIPIEPPAGWDTASVTDISDDGRTVVGALLLWGTAPQSRAFRWMRESGIEPLPLLDQSDTRSGARSISGDGSVIVGSCLGPTGAPTAARWVSGGDPEVLDQGESALARAVSRDGRVIVGFNDDLRIGKIWVDGVHAALGPLPGGSESFGAGVSRDGRRAVGLSGPFSEACYWSADEGVVPIDPVGPGARSLALGANEDGSVIVGRSASRAFRWTAKGGLQFISDLGDVDILSEAQDVSADGAVVVGRVLHGSADSDATVWRDGIGPRSLATMLAEEFGLQPRGWTLSGLYAISSDGQSMVGFGEFNSEVRSFIVRLVCPADYNFDRTIDITDALDFIDEFDACFGQSGSCGRVGTPDINADGEVDILDLLDFLEAFSTECGE